MVTEKIYLDVLADNYKTAAIALINRMNWEVKYCNKIMEVAIPEEDIPIFNFVFDAI